MMVPRSFSYTAAPPMERLDEKSTRRIVRKSMPSKSLITSAPRPTSPARTITEPVKRPTQPVSVPTLERTHSAEPQSMPNLNNKAPTYRRKSSNHDPNALPPAVAALLAVTAIPRPKRSQFRRRSANPRRMSLDELVNEWKNDDILKSTYGSSPGLSILLEDPEASEEPCPTPESPSEESYLHTRSCSAESVPSLEADDRSILSGESLSTPESLRSRKSMSNLKKEKSRSLPASEECASDHPLVPSLDEDDDLDDGLILSSSTASRSTTPKPRPSLKSNLTSSLQALKNAAITSISSLTSSTPQPRRQSSPMPDDVLWSHPFLFPRFSSEVRPAVSDTPSKAKRRYLNPMPLTFEEQEAPFQLALHAPFLAERTESAARIQMQTYNRGRRRSTTKRGPDPQSEAGRALLGAVGVRQREPRENSDFLRVVVCEMNMKRSGKLESGRAKIWLPPRQVSPSTAERSRNRVPRRWIGESAY